MYNVCRHIRTGGGRCRAAALANENFCYYHLSQRRHSITLQLPQLEDRPAIQIAVSRVLAALAAGLIDRRDAGMYLYGIQIASSNLRGAINEIEPEDDDLRSIVLTRDRDEIAKAETIFEEEDDNYRHKKDCPCDACNFTETDNPHHPNCRCGECYLFAEKTKPVHPAGEEEPCTLTLQAVADNSALIECHPERTMNEVKGKSKDPRERVACPEPVEGANGCKATTAFAGSKTAARKGLPSFRNEENMLVNGLLLRDKFELLDHGLIRLI
jgi:hypothetical protein